MQQNKQAIKNGTRAISYCAFFVALMVASSQLAIPLPLVAAPITLSILMVLLCGILGPSLSLLTVCAYILLGLLGVPVFAGFRASEALVSSTGGYIIGYIPTAFAASLCFKYLKKPPLLFLGLFGSVCLCYLCGTIFFAIYATTSFSNALLLCVVPYAPFDILKAVLAVVLGIRLRKLLKA